jgi:hypothetical protein
MRSMPVPPGVRSYSPGATLVPLFAWALMTGGASFLAVNYGLDRVSDSHARSMAFLMAGVGILFGPVAFIAHFLRHCFVWVRIDPPLGLSFSGGRLISWNDIRSVELKEGAFRGLLRVNPILLLLTAGCFAIFYCVVLPSFALFTPWHRRVIVLLRSGEKIVLRDLGQADEFTAEVAGLIRQAASTA